MRQLTLKGYLESYVPYLAGEDTLALARLVRHLPEEPRLVAPMLLWAAVSGRGDRLYKLLQSEDQRRELEVLMSLQSASALESALAEEDPRLRPEYAKTWRSFVARRDATHRDADLKLEARRRALDLASAKGVSRYRMARDLGLNDGNLHAFLAQGKPNALSLKRAFDLVEYLEAA
ncbi:MAG: hypothetical protein U1E29_07850 [Coriobacteriia bacterium]|nr:hypothetical protein [Coriobacteriia bacterium]